MMQVFGVQGKKRALRDIEKFSSAQFEVWVGQRKALGTEAWS